MISNAFEIVSKYCLALLAFDPSEAREKCRVHAIGVSLEEASKPDVQVTRHDMV